MYLKVKSCALIFGNLWTKPNVYKHKMMTMHDKHGRYDLINQISFATFCRHHPLSLVTSLGCDNWAIMKIFCYILYFLKYEVISFRPWFHEMIITGLKYVNTSRVILNGNESSYLCFQEICLNVYLGKLFREHLWSPPPYSRVLCDVYSPNTRPIGNVFILPMAPPGQQ